MRYFFILGEGRLAPQGCNPSVLTFFVCVFGWLYLLPKKGTVGKTVSFGIEQRATRSIATQKRAPPRGAAI